MQIGTPLQIGTFRRNVGRTLAVKPTKLALKHVSKNTLRAQVAQATVSLKTHTGRLLQVLNGYLLGFQQTQEMKDDAFRVLGDVGYDLTALARVLKVKQPSATKKSKLVGTRAAALLHLDSLTTDLLRVVNASLFASPAMHTVTKMVSMPQKGGAKEERQVEVVNLAEEQAIEHDRQNQMRSFLTGAIDVYQRLCLDVTGQVPAAVLSVKLARMGQEHPGISFDAKPKAKKKAQEPVPA